MGLCDLQLYCQALDHYERSLTSEVIVFFLSTKLLSCRQLFY